MIRPSLEIKRQAGFDLCFVAKKKRRTQRLWQPPRPAFCLFVCEVEPLRRKVGVAHGRSRCWQSSLPCRWGNRRSYRQDRCRHSRWFAKAWRGGIVRRQLLKQWVSFWTFCFPPKNSAVIFLTDTTIPEAKRQQGIKISRWGTKIHALFQITRNIVLLC